MAIPTRTAIPGTYFITAATHARRRLFQVPANADLFLTTLQHYRREGHYKLHAFVVMPDHIHPLLTPPAPSNAPCNSSRAASPTASPPASPSSSAALPTTASATAKTSRPATTPSTTTPSAPNLAERPEHYPHSSAYTISA